MIWMNIEQRLEVIAEIALGRRRMGDPVPRVRGWDEAILGEQLSNLIQERASAILDRIFGVQDAAFSPEELVRQALAAEM